MENPEKSGPSGKRDRSVSPVIFPICSSPNRHSPRAAGVSDPGVPRSASAGPRPHPGRGEMSAVGVERLDDDPGTVRGDVGRGCEPGALDLGVLTTMRLVVTPEEPT